MEVLEGRITDLNGTYRRLDRSSKLGARREAPVGLPEEMEKANKVCTGDV